MDLEFNCQYIKEISSRPKFEEDSDKLLIRTKFVEMLDDCAWGLDLASQIHKDSLPCWSE